LAREPVHRLELVTAGLRDQLGDLGAYLTYKEVGLPMLGTISVPNGMDLSYTNVGVSEALVTGAGTYVAVMESLEGIKKASGYLFLDGVITAIQEKVKAAMTAVGAAVRAKMTEMISQYIREMYNIDAKEAAHAGMAISHDKMIKESKGVAKDASEASERGGFRHAQSDARVPEAMRNRPEVMSLLDLVDYFVSHPTASTWWRSIFDSYIASDGEKVHADILARNKTRGRRQAQGK
jgi:hypothetical protein